MLIVVIALAVAACGEREARLDDACVESPEQIERALARAPQPVTLDDGTRLSDCVSRARSDADLQEAGTALTDTASRLAASARDGSSPAALRLGYLIGAARRGGARSNGIHAELVRRLERAGAPLSEDAVTIAAALSRGLQAGEASG